MVISGAGRSTMFVVFWVAISANPANAQMDRYHATQKAPVIPVLEPRTTVDIPPSIRQPSGLAWERSSRLPWRRWTGRLLVSDVVDGKGKVFKIKPDGTMYGGPIDLPTLRPGPVAFDPHLRQLWTIDPRESPIAEDPGEDPGAPDPDSRLFIHGQLPILVKPNQPAVTGISFRARGMRKEIWSCRGGGLCATIEVRDSDSKTKELLWSFFPRCEPIDIAIDPDGRRLWILADNGKGRSTVLLEHLITDSTDDRGPRMSVSQTGRFLALPADVKPTAIISTGKSVWALGRSRQPAVSDRPAKPKLYEFDVGVLP